MAHLLAYNNRSKTTVIKLGQIFRPVKRVGLKISTTMKLISRKNISLGLALLMAGLILSSAKAGNIDPKSRKASFVYSAELVEYVDAYFEEMEMIDMAVEPTIKLYDANDELVFNGTVEEMDEDIAQQYHQAEFMSEMAGAEYYKILY